MPAGASELFRDFDENGEYSLNEFPPQFPNGFYNGSLCPPDGDGVYCSKELLVVTDSIVLILSSASDFSTLVARQSNGQVASTTVQEGVSYLAYVSDLYNNRPPGGSSVSVTTKGDCSLLSTGSFQIADSNNRGAFGGGTEAMNVKIEGNGCPGTMTISTTTSSGIPSTRTYNCNTTIADPNNPPTC